MGVESKARYALDPPPRESDWSLVQAHSELLSPAQAATHSDCQGLMGGRGTPESGHPQDLDPLEGLVLKISASLLGFLLTPQEKLEQWLRTSRN